MHYTTLNEIKKYNPCKSGWKILLVNLGLTDKDTDEDEAIKIQGNNDPLSFKYILESNGIKDAVWVLKTLSFKDQALFRADVAESILHIFEEKYPDDKRPRNAIQGIRDFHAGKIDQNKLKELHDAAAAAYAATYAAANAYVADAYVADAAYAYAAYTAYAATADASTYTYVAAATTAAAAAAAYAAATGATIDAAATATTTATADAAAYTYVADVADAAHVVFSAADTAKKEKWKEIKQIFIKHFCGE